MLVAVMEMIVWYVSGSCCLLMRGIVVVFNYGIFCWFVGCILFDYFKGLESHLLMPFNSRRRSNEY